jgi:hypothetical protein
MTHSNNSIKRHSLRDHRRICCLKSLLSGEFYGICSFALRSLWQLCGSAVNSSQNRVSRKRKPCFTAAPQRTQGFRREKNTFQKVNRNFDRQQWFGISFVFIRCIQSFPDFRTFRLSINLYHSQTIAVSKPHTIFYTAFLLHTDFH